VLLFLPLVALVYGIVDNASEGSLEQKRSSETRRVMLEEIEAGAPGRMLEVILGEEEVQQFCFVPAGSFLMGSSAHEAGRDSHENQVRVTVSQSFWLARTEVTQAQWRVLMGGNPSSFKGANLPVESVSWHDAMGFVGKLNASGLLPAGWKCVLPTEAQWEHACRAGQTGLYSGGSLDEVGWYSGNSQRQTHEVGARKPNLWGLHDMHGNVSEWCADWYGSELSGGVDPQGSVWGMLRIRRGGSWGDGASNCRSAHRGRLHPDVILSLVGFRPALVRMN
jgi:formylglycine-generating enzyme required for sulfatase activity